MNGLQPVPSVLFLQLLDIWGLCLLVSDKHNTFYQASFIWEGLSRPCEPTWWNSCHSSSRYWFEAAFQSKLVNEGDNQHNICLPFVALAKLIILIINWSLVTFQPNHKNATFPPFFYFRIRNICLMEPYPLFFLHVFISSVDRVRC